MYDVVTTGQYQEVQLADCGHSPVIEKQVTVCELVDSFIMKHDGEQHTAPKTSAGYLVPIRIPWNKRK